MAGNSEAQGWKVWTKRPRGDPTAKLAIYAVAIPDLDQALSIIGEYLRPRSAEITHWEPADPFELDSYRKAKIATVAENIFEVLA